MPLCRTHKLNVHWFLLHFVQSGPVTPTTENRNLNCPIKLKAPKTLFGCYLLFGTSSTIHLLCTVWMNPADSCWSQSGRLISDRFVINIHLFQWLHKKSNSGLAQKRSSIPLTRLQVTPEHFIATINIWISDGLLLSCISLVTLESLIVSTTGLGHIIRPPSTHASPPLLRSA